MISERCKLRARVKGDSWAIIRAAGCPYELSKHTNAMLVSVEGTFDKKKIRIMSLLTWTEFTAFLFFLLFHRHSLICIETMILIL